MADIFISYARVDQALIKRLSQFLEHSGYSVWWDRELLAGDEYTNDIERELVNAKAVIVNWSNTSKQSRWVRDEAAVAADDGKLIAISVEGCEPPIGFRQFHCVDFSSWDNSACDQPYLELLRAIETRISSQGKGELNSPFSASPVYRKKPPEQEKSKSRIVAVLPFANRSSLDDDAYFADAIHDELITHISHLESMQVISRTSVLKYREQSKSVPEIAHELGATVILEGAVQRAGKRVRINVQLIDGQSDTNLWADKYDRELSPENIFDIQSEITRVIASSLHAVLTETEQNRLKANAPTNNLLAYDAFLRGKQKMRSEAAGVNEYHDAIAEFDSAILHDPQFAEPYANKARAYLTIYWFFGWDRQWVSLAREAVSKAQSLAPDSIETLLAQAYYHYWGELDLKHAETVLNRILHISPQNTEAWACKAYVVRRLGRIEESIEGLNNALKLDPMLVDLPMEQSNNYSAIGMVHEAEEMINKVKVLAPKAGFTAVAGADTFFLAGNAHKAYELASMPVDDPDMVYYYRRAFHAFNTGNQETIEQATASWPVEYHSTPHFPETFNLYNAMANKFLGRKSEADGILQGVRDRLSKLKDPYPGGWLPEVAYFPVTLPGLMRDLEQVERAVQQYEDSGNSDKFATIYHFHAIASAYADCGEADLSLDYLEKLIPIFGICAFAAMSIMPNYKSLHKASRFNNMRLQYESWLSKQNHCNTLITPLLNPHI